MTRDKIVVLCCAGTVALGTGCSGATLADEASASDAGAQTDSGAATGTVDDGRPDGACGNGMIEAGEACDGSVPAEQTCASRPGFMGGTLGCTPTCLFDTTLCTIDPTVAVVRLNEVTASDVAAGPFAGGSDAIEIHNPGGVAADLSGYAVSDDPDFAADKTYVFPDGTLLMAGEFVVLVRLDETTGQGQTPFGISSTNPEVLTLRDAQGTTVDSVAFNGPDAEVSWCRAQDGTGSWQACAQTFGASNETTVPPQVVCGDEVAEGDEVCDGTDLRGLSCPDVDRMYVGGTLSCTAMCTLNPNACALDPLAQLVINELTSSGDDTIELFNGGRQALDLTGFVLTDALADPDDPYDPDADVDKLQFAAGTVIDPGGYLAVDKGPLPLHPFGLGASGDAVTLLDASLNVVDFVQYGADEATESYCRSPDGPDGLWMAGCVPSFGTPNP